MGEAKRKSTVESLQAEVAALRSANEGLRQKVRECEARLVRQQAQFQGGLARAEATVVELRMALAQALGQDAEAAEKHAADHRPKGPPAGQVAPPPSQG